MTTTPKSVVPETGGKDSGQWYDVHAMDSVTGVGRRLERIKAASRQAAEETAIARNGRHILVSLAGGSPTQPYRRALDIGNTRSRRKTQ